MVTKWLFTSLTVWVVSYLVIRMNSIEWGVRAHLNRPTVPMAVTTLLFYLSGIATTVLLFVAIWVKS